MKSNVKIALCTDFSGNSGRALESLLFNSWSFKVDIDVIHLVEDDYQKSKDNLNALEIELKHTLSNISEVKMYLFKEGQRDSLMEQLNTSGYIIVVSGLQGTGKGEGWGSFIKTIYKEVNCNVMVVPMACKIKIENKVMVAIELENIRYLNILLKAQAFFRLNYFKLTIVIRTLKELALKEKRNIQEQLNEIFPSLEQELILYNPENYQGNLLEQLSTYDFGYCFVFKDDFFDKFFINIFETHPDRSTIKEKVVRIMTFEREIELAKTNSELLERFELRDF